jgi:hypothetical protein
MRLFRTKLPFRIGVLTDEPFVFAQDRPFDTLPLCVSYSLRHFLRSQYRQDRPFDTLPLCVSYSGQAQLTPGGLLMII